MSADRAAAEEFIWANARLLDRRRLERLRGGPVEPVIATLRAYLNDDGGFGSALEPDVRGPHSEPTAVLHGLEVFAEIDALDDPLVGRAAEWVDSHALADGGVPFVVAETKNFPRGPWMEPTDGGSHLTFGLAGVLYGLDLPWVQAGTAWCWDRLEAEEPLDAYALKYALSFLDAVPAQERDSARADAALNRLQALVDEDGTVPVDGGEQDEKLTALDLSPGVGVRSTSLFTAEAIANGLDRVEAEQRDDGGWDFDWLAWSPGQSAEWRGLVTMRNLGILIDHGRLDNIEPTDQRA